VARVTGAADAPPASVRPAEHPTCLNAGLAVTHASYVRGLAVTPTANVLTAAGLADCVPASAVTAAGPAAASVWVYADADAGAATAAAAAGRSVMVDAVVDAAAGTVVTPTSRHMGAQFTPASLVDAAAGRVLANAADGRQSPAPEQRQQII